MSEVTELIGNGEVMDDMVASIIERRRWISMDPLCICLRR